MQSQTDWAGYPAVNVGEGPQPLSTFVISLSAADQPVLVQRLSQREGAGPCTRGQEGRGLREIYLMPVERRPVELYAELARVAR